MEEETKTMNRKKAHEVFWGIGMLTMSLVEGLKLSKKRQERLMDALAEAERALFPHPGSRKKSEEWRAKHQPLIILVKLVIEV